MARVVKAPTAESDLLDLFVFLGRGSVRAANRFLEAADQTCVRLAEMPGLGGECESAAAALAGLRLWPVRGFPKYLILYRPIAGGIEVLRVFHGARDIESLFDL